MLHPVPAQRVSAADGYEYVDGVAWKSSVTDDRPGYMLTRGCFHLEDSKMTVSDDESGWEKVANTNIISYEGGVGLQINSAGAAGLLAQGKRYAPSEQQVPKHLPQPLHTKPLLGTGDQ